MNKKREFQSVQNQSKSLIWFHARLDTAIRHSTMRRWRKKEKQNEKQTDEKVGKMVKDNEDDVVDDEEWLCDVIEKQTDKNKKWFSVVGCKTIAESNQMKRIECRPIYYDYIVCTFRRYFLFHFCSFFCFRCAVMIRGANAIAKIE